jgi:hypothetical protein
VRVLELHPVICAAGDEPATLLFDFMHPFGAALAALGRLRKGWWDEAGRQWTWEVHVFYRVQCTSVHRPWSS